MATNNYPTTLYVFDFDSTTFRSPEAPEWFAQTSQKNWWLSQESLSAPYVPGAPGAEWFVAKTVVAIRDAMADPDGIVVLLTDRDLSLRFRVHEILRRKGLKFDGTYFNQRGGSTSAFKLGVFKMLLQKYPTVDHVHVWEDRAEHLRLFTQRLEAAGVTVTPVLIRDNKPPLTAGREGVEYLQAKVLNPESVAEWFTRHTGSTLLPDVKADHITLIYEPDPDDLLDAEPWVGKAASYKIVGYVDTPKAQAVVVSPVGEANRVPSRSKSELHITIATTGVSGVASNQAIKKGWTPVANGPTVVTTIAWADLNGLTRTDSYIRVAAQYLKTSSEHQKSVALMKFLADVSAKMGVAKHVYVVGGAVRNWVLGVPIKDIDVVVDSVGMGRNRDSDWFAKELVRFIPASASHATNQYGVAIVTVSGDWVLDGVNLKGEVIEIANARKESYGGETGKGYKPDNVEPANIREDVYRREFTFNALLWSMAELANGPDKAEILDITGCGLRDLKDGVMRCPSDPDKTFSDDPTRLIRATKFFLKYNFKMDPDTLAAIKRNAHKIKNVPQNAVATILMDSVLTEPSGKKAVQYMDSIGILDPLKELLVEDQNFRTTLFRFVRSKPVQYLYELLDLGFPFDNPVGFLNPRQQARFREWVFLLSPDEGQTLHDNLHQPGKAWGDKTFIPTLVRETGTSPKNTRDIADQASAIARDALLDDPNILASDLRRIIRDAMGLSGKTASGPDMKPPQAVADAAAKGLEYRQKASPSNKGGLTTGEAGKQGIGSGVQRAVNLKNRDNVTEETLRKMVAFFARHEKNKSVSAENRATPWNDKGHVAWLLWGGDPGRAWATKKLKEMEAHD